MYWWFPIFLGGINKWKFLYKPHLLKNGWTFAFVSPTVNQYGMWQICISSKLRFYQLSAYEQISLCCVGDLTSFDRNVGHMNRHRQPHNFWSAKDKNKLHILKSISFGQIGIQELSSIALVCQEFRCEFKCGGFCGVVRFFSLSVVVKTGLICSIKVRGFVNLLIYILI